MDNSVGAGTPSTRALTYLSATGLDAPPPSCTLTRPSAFRALH